MERPGNGYGRVARRPGPPVAWREVETLAELRAWDPVELLTVHLDAASAASDDAAVSL
jgi:hypothetical protein